VIYWQLFILFSGASILAFGGAIGMLPTINDTVVNTFHWMSNDAVVRTYVLAQFMPGPNMVMATLIGLHVAGLKGAAASTFGMYLAPVMLTTIVTRLYYQNREKSYVRRGEIALRPLALGLVLAATLGFLREQMTDNAPVGLIISIPVVWLHWRGRLNVMLGVMMIGGGWFVAYRLGLLATN
jgi:chromate transporter